GSVPKAVTAGMMAAAAAGTAGVRLYQFETPADYEGQRSQGPGGGGIQTGADPRHAEVNNWRAMGYAASILTRTLQPYILGKRISSPAQGRNIVTAARQGPDAKMLMIVNSWDAARRIRVDFRPYDAGFGFTRYR